MKLDVGFEGARADRMLSGIRGRLDNTRTLMGMLVDDIHDFEADAFDTGGFGQWAPLSPATLRAKGGGRILVDTGALRSSLTAGSASITADGVTVGTSERSAPFLQRGARGAPPRDPMPDPPARVVEDWASKVLGYVVGGHR